MVPPTSQRQEKVDDEYSVILIIIQEKSINIILLNFSKLITAKELVHVFVVVCLVMRLLVVILKQRTSPFVLQTSVPLKHLIATIKTNP